MRFILCLSLASCCVTVPHAAGQAPTFRATTDAVAVNVSVKQGRAPVSGLSATDFRLTDNGVAQDVAAVSLDAVPVDLSIVVDTSASAFPDLDVARTAVRGMAEFLRPSDRFRVLTMGNSVVSAIPWRSAGVPDTARIQLVEGNISLIADAVVLALFHRPDLDRRHLVVVLTDGDDICSMVSGDALKKGAERSGAVLHWIDIQLERGKARTASMSQGLHASCRWARLPSDMRPFLSEAVRQTGGTVHTAWYGGAKVTVDAFDEIFDDFRRSYIRHYVPVGVERGGFHKLSVTAPSKNYSIGARPGYWSPK